MPSINLNLEDAVVLSELSQGEHPCTVQEISGINQGANSQYLKVTLAVSEGEEAGKLCWVNLPIDGKGAGIFVDFYNKAMGTDYDVSALRDEGLEIDTDDMIGAEVIAVITHEEYPAGSGEFRANVKKVLAA